MDWGWIRRRGWKIRLYQYPGTTSQRVYAVGEITGGFFYHNYPSGTGLVRGVVMGRIAGAEAVAYARSLGNR